MASAPDSLAGADFTHHELTLWIEPAQLLLAMKLLQETGYNFLSDVTCVDLYPAEPRFQITYHLLSHRFRERIRLCARVGGSEPVIDSITSIWPAANFYEREVWDLFGVRFHNHPNPRRIMMPEDWEGHPLRKDYPVEGYR